MPELPDIVAYVEAIGERTIGRELTGVRIQTPFLLRTTQPPVADAVGRTVREIRRVGKRIAIGLDQDLWLVLHLMIAGRLHWKKADAKLAGKQSLAAFDFEHGSMVLTEAGSQRRASLHVLKGEADLRRIDPGGLEVLTADWRIFAEALRRENHTLKRSLTDPHLFSGIGNAYSDEILHRARLSPVALSQKLSDEEVQRLYEATTQVLHEWMARFRQERNGGFPEHVTAFREGMAVHGRYGQPCPVCGAKVQRIRYAANETNYCAVCQTGGKLLADRALSRLLREDWPRSLDEMDALIRRAGSQ